MKLLVVGASGYLGSEILKTANESGADVLGTYLHNKQNNLLHFDCDNPSENMDAYKFSPDCVIWSMSSGSPPDLSSLRKSVQSFGKIKHIYISSDVVTCPRTLNCDSSLGNYARQKLTEQKLFTSIAKSLIVIPGPIYGVNSRGDIDLRTKQILENPDEKYEFWEDVYKTFTSIKTLARTILDNVDYSGQYFVGPPKKSSYYNFFVRRLAESGMSHIDISPTTITNQELAKKGLCRDTSFAHATNRLWDDTLPD